MDAILIERMEKRAANLRELARCGIITKDGREALKAAAELYEARAHNMAQRRAS